MVDKPEDLVGMLEQMGGGAETDHPIGAVDLDQPKSCHLPQQVFGIIRERKIGQFYLMAAFPQFLRQPFDNEPSAPIDERHVRGKQHQAHKLERTLRMATASPVLAPSALKTRAALQDATDARPTVILDSSAG